ncbi:MAG: hydrolase [Burkholderiaceae bacterium]|jgi:nicotinamidase-related amidase|nr:hydrolase [Burkholderiaceae bacterium]
MDKTILEQLTPQNSILLMIDLQPQMAFGVGNMDRQELKNNVVALAKAAKVFNVPTFITTVETESFSGYTFPELTDVFPSADIYERSSMNSWDSKKLRDAIKATRRKKLIACGLWTEVCINTAVNSAMLDGFEAYVVADACGGTSLAAHNLSVERMIQAGIRPLSWQQLILEWQRDWARRETYDAIMDIVREHSGGYGMGVDYAYTMVHKQPQRGKWKGKIVKAPTKL